jgi:hypothetical protein
MFTDGRWHKRGGYIFNTEIDGKKVGVVAATMSPSYDRFALNKADYEYVHDAKRSGKVDLAFVVAAAFDAGWRLEYRGAGDLERMAATLANLDPRGGRNGPFWTLRLDDIDPDAPWC